MNFKVWDSIDKMWVAEHNYVMHSQGALSWVSDYDELQLIRDGLVLVFSTGKTDIKGNELFTGDIRGANWWKYEICFGDYMIENDDCNITLDLTGFYIKYLDRKHGVDFFDDNLTDPHLGNKFENPELLEEK